jgi:hypothetical protein
MDNKINTYTCPKGHVTVTIDREYGVTPMMLGCQQNCTEMARSGWYRVSQDLKPEYEWYKPKTTKGLNINEKDHVERGGLLLKKIN